MSKLLYQNLSVSETFGFLLAVDIGTYYCNVPTVLKDKTDQCIIIFIKKMVVTDVFFSNIYTIQSNTLF